MMTRRDNPTRAAIADAIAHGQSGQPLPINPAMEYLQAVFVAGEPGRVTLQFTAPQTSIQGNGVVGGGTLASMLDIGMAMAVLSRLDYGRTCATINLSVNMLAPAQPGNFLVTAHVEKLGRQIAFSAASLVEAHSERLVATASSSLAVLEER